MSIEEQPFTSVFSDALRGQPCRVVGIELEPQTLPVHEWTGRADEVDLAMLADCLGPTVDIGCGPGRLSAQLAELGHVVLGIDVVGEAVRQTRDRGASAIVRDVFETLPGEGRWETALLADGNVGIGGNPTQLLRRARELLDPRGRIVVEVAGPGVPSRSIWASLESGTTRSRPFRWSVVGVDAVEGLAADIGMVVVAMREVGDRWWSVLEEPV